MKIVGLSARLQREDNPIIDFVPYALDQNIWNTNYDNIHIINRVP